MTVSTLVSFVQVSMETHPLFGAVKKNHMSCDIDNAFSDLLFAYLDRISKTGIDMCGAPPLSCSSRTAYVCSTSNGLP